MVSTGSYYQGIMAELGVFFYMGVWWGVGGAVFDFPSPCRGPAVSLILRYTKSAFS